MIKRKSKILTAFATVDFQVVGTRGITSFQLKFKCECPDLVTTRCSDDPTFVYISKTNKARQSAGACSAGGGGGGGCSAGGGGGCSAGGGGGGGGCSDGGCGGYENDYDNSESFNADTMWNS